MDYIDIDELNERVKRINDKVHYLSLGLLPFHDLERIIESYYSEAFKNIKYEKCGFEVTFHINDYRRVYLDFDGEKYELTGKIRDKKYDKYNIYSLMECLYLVVQAME